ncbi:MAG: hypothetical protein IPM34_09240 [Saprospiraceae bacterium]|nr:hypothetical protein [Saprospiraceae bacterium]
MKCSLHSIYFLLFGYAANAQLPVSQLFYVRVHSIQDSACQIKQMAYLSAFNESAYNNQPFLISDSVLLATIESKSENQTDIYRFNIQNRSFEKLTHTADREYSPRIDPANDQTLSYIRVPATDSSRQNLVVKELTNRAKTKILFEELNNLGYYRLYQGQTYVLFLVGSGHKLAICNAETKSIRVFASSIGRCFEVLRNGNIIFTDKSDPEIWSLKEYDPRTQTMKTLLKLPPETEDFALDQNEQIYCTKGSEILKWNGQDQWKPILQLASYGMRNIQRLSIHKNSMAFVNLP